MDFIPTEAYGQSDADYALAAARQATAALEEETLAH